MSIERNLPATRSETGLVEVDGNAPLPRRRPITVALLPLALVTFIMLAFAIAAWTFLSAAT